MLTATHAHAIYTITQVKGKDYIWAYMWS